MSEPAWPFLVGRSRNAGYRVIVAPQFMVGKLREVVALGRLATSDDTESKEAIVKEISEVLASPATAIFRNLAARADEFCFSGSDLLVDAVGRTITLTEGFVLKLPEAQVGQLSLTTADLDRAHKLIVPFFRDFWKQEQFYDQKYSQPFLVGINTEQAIPLILRNSRSLDRYSNPYSQGENKILPEFSGLSISAEPKLRRSTASYRKPRSDRHRLSSQRVRGTMPTGLLALAAITAAGAILLAILGITSLTIDTQGKNSSSQPAAKQKNSHASRSGGVPHRPPSGSATVPVAVFVVEDYFEAIAKRDYRRAWDLGGNNLGESYSDFVSSFAVAITGHVVILGVNGNAVTASVSIIQTNGMKSSYVGSYIVVNGRIAHFGAQRFGKRPAPIPSPSHAGSPKPRA